MQAARFTVTADYGTGRTRRLADATRAEVVDFIRAALKYDPAARFTLRTRPAPVWL